MIGLFEQSFAFTQLAPLTQGHYRGYAAAIKTYPLKNGSPLRVAIVDRLTPGVVRRLVDVVAQGVPAGLLRAAGRLGYPTKANHWLRYLRRVFGWAREHKHVKSNPAAGVKQVKEKRGHRIPEL